MTGFALIQVTGAQVKKRNGKRTIRVVPACQAWARRHQHVLRRAIRHPPEDIDLADETSPDQLQRLGFIHDPDLGWACNDGCEVGELVILGLEPPRESIQDVPLVPPVVVIEAEKVGPGRFKWTEPPGVRAVVMHHGRRIA